MAKLNLADWALPLLTVRKRFKVLYGGRGSGKTWAIAACLVLDAARKPLRIACVREHQKSIKESAKHRIERWIHDLGLSDRFTITRENITCDNGSHFFFAGMSTATEEDVKGWESVNRCWFEEAHRMSERSRELLYPTVFRTDDSEIWISFNPKNRSDPVYQDFALETGGRRTEAAYVRKINFMDNPWFPPGLEEERVLDKKNQPERYAHIWLGEPDDEGLGNNVLPYALMEMCVEAWSKRPRNPAGAIEGSYYVGLDVADGGQDRNCMVTRKGPCITDYVTWSSAVGELGRTARRMDGHARSIGAVSAYYDAGGPGQGVRSHLREMGRRPYGLKPIIFGSEVAGRDRMFQRGSTNFEYFARRNAQLGWAPRMRAQMTRRLLDGENVPKFRCLFINPRLPRLESFLAVLNQPIFEEDLGGRLRIRKQPEDTMPSPDEYDGTVLAFAHDSRFGLKLR